MFIYCGQEKAHGLEWALNTAMNRYDITALTDTALRKHIVQNYTHGTQRKGSVVRQWALIPTADPIASWLNLKI